MVERASGRIAVVLFGALAVLAAAAGGYLLRRAVRYDVVATAETLPVPNDGDAADDACVVVDPGAPERSLLVATDKKGGLQLLDLAGRQIDFLKLGRINNVDSRPEFVFADGASGPLVAASDKDEDAVRLFRVDFGARRLLDAGMVKAPAGIGVDGLCLYRSGSSGKMFAFVTTKDGEVVQLELFDGERTGQGETVRKLVLGSESEGCVADDDHGLLYVAEENVGIWRLSAEPDGGEARRLVDSVGFWGRLENDVEGLALYRGADGRGYLLASNQGKGDFLAYRREGSNACVGRFRVAAGGAIDGVSHTDGIAVSSAALGPDFPRGVLVVQDDENEGGRQNFKLIPWEHVEAALDRLF